jgi:hypothetical protein
MEGQVTAYSGTSLTLNVDLASGVGTHADWNLNLAGTQGAQGPAGSTGPPGPGIAEAPTDSHNYARNNSAWNNIDTVIATKAPLASPTFTGDPQAPTPATADNDTSIATTAFVQAALAAGGYLTDAPNNANTYGRHALAWSALDTVFAKLASPALTGSPTAPTPTPSTDNSTKIATTAFVQALLGSGGTAGAITLEVSLANNQTGLTAGAWNLVKYDTKVTDVQNAYNLASGIFTPTVAGLYAISASVGAAWVGNGIVGVAILKNGSLSNAESQSIRIVSGGAYTGAQTISALIYCNGTTDTIQVQGIQSTNTQWLSTANAGATVNMVATLLGVGPQGPPGASTGPIIAQGPTVQKITTTGAFTYTPTNAGGQPVLWIKIRAAASGGGGSATSGAANGTAAAALTFVVGGVTALTLGGGGGAAGISGGAGGAVTVGTLPGNWAISYSAAGGQGSNGATIGSYNQGGVGGANMFGSFGPAGGQTAAASAVNGTGGGGGGGGWGGGSVAAAGAGGGAGGCAEIIITNPTTITGTLGNFGAAGAAGGQYAGANGALGGIYIEEHYNW